MTSTAVTVGTAHELRAVQEFYAAREWTDGLPVVPVTEDYLDEFLATTDRDPNEVLFRMPHLNRDLTVRLAAINAALAGCLPHYFPVIVAAWRAIALERFPVRGIWQSTTGTAPFLVVNGPVTSQIALNSSGNIFGSGFRANATIGRAIRLASINVFGLQPHRLDQATQGNPSKFAAAFAENEAESPWEPFHVEHGYAASDSVVSAFVIRTVMHVEARHTRSAEQLGRDFVNSITRTGALLHEYNTSLLVVGPEHARVFADQGWDKSELRRFVFENAVLPRSALAEVGKDAISSYSRWRLPADHPDAIADEAAAGDRPDTVRALSSPEALQIVVAGANNAGVSAVVDIFGSPRGVPVSLAQVE